MKEIFPEIVKENRSGINHVNYSALIPVLIEAFKEQQQHIDDLTKSFQLRVADQDEKISQLTNQLQTSTGINSINQSGTDTKLEQNEPNPFTHETTIRYTLPNSVISAFLVVYDLSGKQIVRSNINQRGSSSIIITSKDLADGMYIYSIVADGKIIDSKRMVVSEE